MTSTAAGPRPGPGCGAADLLDAARGLVMEGWCTHALALDSEGRSVRPENPAARRWCARGAVLAAAHAARCPGTPTEAAALAAAGDCAAELLAAAGKRGTAPLSDWNDALGRSAPEVAALLARAADRVRTEATA